LREALTMQADRDGAAIPGEFVYRGR
jgi:hypothetical protein